MEYNMSSHTELVLDIFHREMEACCARRGPEVWGMSVFWRRSSIFPPSRDGGSGLPDEPAARLNENLECWNNVVSEPSGRVQDVIFETKQRAMRACGH